MSEPPPWMVHWPLASTADPLKVGPPTSALSHWTWALVIVVQSANTPSATAAQAVRQRDGWVLVFLAVEKFSGRQVKPKDVISFFMDVWGMLCYFRIGLFSVFLSERGLLIKPMRDTRGTFATTRTGIGLISRLCTMQHAPEDSTRTLPGVRSGLCQRVRAISSDSRKHGKIKNTHFLA